jgi:hypothetical protein
MSTRFTKATLLLLLEGDEALYQRLREASLLPERDEEIAPQHAEIARVAHTLVRELEVNVEGVEIVLRMRSELIASRQQVAELLRLLARTGGR